MLYRLAPMASHPPANYELMQVRLVQGAVGVLVVFAFLATVVWLVVRLNREPVEPAGEHELLCRGQAKVRTRLRRRRVAAQPVVYRGDSKVTAN